MNAKKSAIMPVKCHSSITQLTEKYPNYPIVEQYRYLGVEIDRTGSIRHYLDRIKARANYLTSCMRYYAKDLSFQNQYLLWTCYVKPYFTYVASIINSQRPALIEMFNREWRKSIKQLLGLP